MAATVTKITEREGVTYVDFAPDTNLDALTVESTRDELYGLVQTQQNLKVVLDFSNVDFLASMALGMLVTLRLKAARNGSSVVLAGVRPMLTDIIAVTQIDKLYGVFPTREAAAAHLQSA